MKPSEFESWWTDLAFRFPSVDAWLCRTYKDDSEQRRFLRQWQTVLADVDCHDAMEVNRKMQAGDLPWIADFGEQLLPQHVRRLAKQLAAERMPAAASEESRSDLRPGDFPAGRILRRVFELTDRGVESEEAKRIAISEIPLGHPNYEPRYHCHLCRDSGSVFVASKTAIEFALAEKFHECHHRIGTMRCVCKAHMPSNPKFPVCLYDERQDFRIEDFLWRQPEVDRFLAWVESQRQAYWDSKRERDFDAFNQREFV